MTAEIISTIERRRNWPTAEKLRIMEEALAPGASIAAVADRNGVCRSLLYTWLRLARTGKMPRISIDSPATATASFVPVRIEPPEPSPARDEPNTDVPAAPRPPARGRRRCQVEITLANGRVVKVDACIDPTVLAGLVAVLDGGAR